MLYYRFMTKHCICSMFCSFSALEGQFYYLLFLLFILYKKGITLQSTVILKVRELKYYEKDRAHQEV